MIPKDKILNEISLIFSRSSGPGGQNVNKVNTKVELRFNVNNSEALSDNQKTLLHRRLKSRINNDGELILSSQLTRSQIQNKINVTEKFFDLIENSLKTQKKRIRTKPNKSSVEKRLKFKKIKSEIKKSRKNPFD